MANLYALLSNVSEYKRQQSSTNLILDQDLSQFTWDMADMLRELHAISGNHYLRTEIAHRDHRCISFQ